MNEIERDAARESARKTGAGRRSEDLLSERFITALEVRLASSELQELGWRGREDLGEVLQDLQRLAAVDFRRASELWEKYRPRDPDKPPFLDESQRTKARAPESDAAQATSPSREPEFVVPEQVRKRYLVTDAKYYFRHEDNKLAFQDHGHKMVTQYDDPIVALSMVQIAQARGWQSIRLRGSQDFRREAWLQASLKGLEVKGYRPRSVDNEKLAELERELGTTIAPPRAARAAPRHSASASPSGPMAERNTPNEVVDRAAVVDEPRRSLTPQQRLVLETVRAVWRQQGATDAEVDTAAAATVERFQNQRVYVGKIAERGEAPFENVPANEKSFFVKLDTPKGEKTIWGVDLRRALEEANVAVGEEVVIANQGRQPVQITVKNRDEAGNVASTSTMTTHRNTWRVETLASLRQEVLEQVRSKAAHADRAPLISVYDRAADRAIPRMEVKVEKSRDQERSR